MEVEPIRVRAEAGRPVRQPAVQTAERLDGVLPDLLADDRGEVAGVHPSHAGLRALFVSRDPFDLPGRQVQIWKRDGRSTEYGTHRSGPAHRPIEVHDVRELVHEDEAQPVVDVA